MMNRQIRVKNLLVQLNVLLLHVTLEINPCKREIVCHAYSDSAGGTSYISRHVLLRSIIRGSCPPLADNGGKRYQMPPPPFRRLSGMMPASTEKTYSYVWKWVKYYQKMCKICLIFLYCYLYWYIGQRLNLCIAIVVGRAVVDPSYNFSTPSLRYTSRQGDFVPRPSTGAPPLDPAGHYRLPYLVVLPHPNSQTSFRRLWLTG